MKVIRDSRSYFWVSGVGIIRLSEVNEHYRAVKNLNYQDVDFINIPQLSYQHLWNASSYSDLMRNKVNF